MNFLRFVLWLGVSLASHVLPSLALAAASAEEPVIWRLNEIEKFSGQTSEILGQPRVQLDAEGAAVFFNGISDGLLLPLNPVRDAPEFTIEVLFKPEAGGAEEQRFLHIQGQHGNRALLEIRLWGREWALDTFLNSPANSNHLALLDPKQRHPSDRWTWVALVYGGGRLAHYIEGVKELEGPVSFAFTAPGQISLGVRQNKVSWFKGAIREVRFHRTALPAASLQHTSR